MIQVSPVTLPKDNAATPFISIVWIDGLAAKNIKNVYYAQPLGIQSEMIFKNIIFVLVELLNAP